MKLNRTVVVLILVILCGCQAMIYGTAKSMNRLSVGMDKDEVIQRLGMPDSTAAFQGGEYLNYKLMDGVISDWPKEYFVKIEEGKVTSFGRKGDFGSTQSPTMNVNLTQNVKPNPALAES